MRKCKSCGEIKPLNLFASAGIKNGNQYYRWKCIPCYSKQKGKERRDYVEKFLEFKKTLKCSRCGNTDYRVFEFHHKDGDDKFMALSDMVRRRHNWDSVMSEVEKCECLCANCHRIEHWSE
jgi:hypothetical protein